MIKLCIKYELSVTYIDHSKNIKDKTRPFDHKYIKKYSYIVTVFIVGWYKLRKSLIIIVR